MTGIAIAVVVVAAVVVVTTVAEAVGVVDDAELVSKKAGIGAVHGEVVDNCFVEAEAELAGDVSAAGLGQWWY